MSGGLIVPNDLVGWWCPSLDATGSLLVDRSGRNNHGTLTNMDPASDWVISGGKLALDFDGGDDFVALPQLLGGVTRFSVSIWVSSNAAQAAYFSAGASSGITTDVLFAVTSSLLFAQVNNGTDGSATVSYTPSLEWRMLSLVFNGNHSSNAEKLKIFVDGVEQTLSFNYTVPSSTANPASASMRIGSYVASPSTWFLNGRADDLRIYNRALTAGEVRQLWQIGRGNMPLRRRRRYAEQAAGFKGYWARNNSRLIGAGNVS
jgi:hypothetical protein